MINLNTKKLCQSVILAACLALLSGHAMAYDYQPPELDGFKPHVERDADGDDDGVKETHLKQYFNVTGDSIVSMTTNGRVWAWSLKTNNDESAIKNYVIRDSNCDGQFDEIYGLSEEFHVPDCVKVQD